MKAAWTIALFTILSLCAQLCHAQDPNFLIFLCFGQSNMEGQGTIQSQDKTVDDRFKVFQTVDCSNLNRTKEKWYPAIPPLTRCWNKLSPADYFGRTLVDELPEHIKIGVINVSIGGCRIELFDKDIYKGYTNDYKESWFQDAIASYDGNPYAYMVKMAKLAQKDGVIKGILLHQGESNYGDSKWPDKVKKIYEDLIKDLELDATNMPLLAGEVVNEDQGGGVAGMNAIIAKLPETISNSYVISSSGCTDQSDNIHFDSEGYRELGKRYAEKMLTLLDYDENAPVLGVETKEEINDYFLSQSYPNPTNGQAAISFRIPHATFVSIKVYDLLGRKMADVVGSHFAQGEHIVDYHFNNLPKGTYFYSMKVDGHVINRRVVLK